MSAENDENATAIDGILPIFEGQKNYPQLKITVDYSIVEHCEHNCIEVIGICLPSANPTGGRNASTTETGDGEPKTPPSIVRLYVNADDFYSKVTTDKKALDKKNRRPEQIIPIRSKLMRNMVAQSLLGAMTLMKSPDDGYGLNMPPLDGKQFDTPKPPDVVPFDAPGFSQTPSHHHHTYRDRTFLSLITPVVTILSSSLLGLTQTPTMILSWPYLFYCY